MKRFRVLLARLRPIIGVLGPHRRLFVVSTVAGILQQLSAMATAGMGAWIVGRAVTGTPVRDQFAAFVWLCVLSLAGQVLNIVDGWSAHTMSWRAQYDLRVALHRKFDDLGPAYLMERRSGDVARVALADIGEIELYTSHVLPPILSGLIVPIGATVAVGLLHPLFAVVLGPLLLATATVPFWLGRRAEEQGRRTREAAGRLGSIVVDSVQGLREVTAFNAERRTLERIDVAQAEMVDATLEHARRVAVERIFTIVLLSGGMLVTLVLGAWLASSGRLDISLFPAAVVLAGAAFAPIIALTAIGGELQRVAACADRVWAILRAEPTVHFTSDVEVAGHIEPTVSFDHVTFRYRNGLEPALSDVSFGIGPGEQVALVGHSGAGKSTCTHLLQRLWDPEVGSIRIGGHDLRDLPEHQLRQLVATVPQDVYLFNASVADNLRIGRADATETDLRDAAKQALALEFIEALPDGFETILGERGATLSGGQRQRLAIARALLHDSPIMIFDEAVSNLDTESEAAIRIALRAASVGRTTLIIAHRPSTIRTADRIVVLDHGRVVEEGTFSELIGAGGPLGQLLADPLPSTSDSPPHDVPKGPTTP